MRIESMGESGTQISVVIPAYNEEENLGPLMDEVSSVMDSLGRSYEIIVINDGSTDGSARVLRELSRRYPGLRPITLACNSGQTTAFAAGFAEARGDVVITMDADLQNNPADIPRMLEYLDTHDVICGIRRRRRDSFLRLASSKIANAIRRAVIHDNITDIGCSLKVFRKVALDKLLLFDGMHRFFPALLEWEGCRIMEVEVDHRPRRAGTPKYNIRNRLFRTVADLLVVRWMKSRRLKYEIKK